MAMGEICKKDTFFSVLTDMVRIVEIGSLWTWGAVVLAMIVAFRSVGVRNIRIILLRRFLPIRSTMSNAFFVKDDDWDSLSYFSSDDDDVSDDEAVSSISDEDELVETRGSSDDEWRWSNKSSVSLSEIGSGRDSVVESWQEQGRDKEVGFVMERRNRFFEIPTAQIVSAWEDGGQMLRRVVDLGHRGEEKLIHLRHAYATDLASFVDLKLSVAAAAVVDDGGSLEAAVMGLCRNAASCLPLLPASTSK